jgi:hypothetical protein
VQMRKPGTQPLGRDTAHCLNLLCLISHQNPVISIC